MRPSRKREHSPRGRRMGAAYSAIVVGRAERSSLRAGLGELEGNPLTTPEALVYDDYASSILKTGFEITARERGFALRARGRSCV